MTHTEEWPFYCATFHVATEWYGDHPSDELFAFLMALEPGWPYFSSDPGNWLEWTRLSDAMLGEHRKDDPPFYRHYLIAAAYVALWGSRDEAAYPGVRALVAEMCGHNQTAQSMRDRWTAVVIRCANDPTQMGGPYTIPPPPSG